MDKNISYNKNDFKEIQKIYEQSLKDGLIQNSGSHNKNTENVIEVDKDWVKNYTKENVK